MLLNVVQTKQNVGCNERSELHLYLHNYHNESGAMRSAYCTLRCWRAANPDLISGDNSAAALLARIQAERAAAKPRKNRRV